MLSEVKNGPSMGMWVALAVVRTAGGSLISVPVLDNEDTTGSMRRWTCLDAVLRGAYNNSAIRVGGGWAIHLESGQIEEIKPVNQSR